MPGFNRPTLMALLALPLLTVPAVATVFVPISDATLADRAPVILEGRISAVEPASGERPAIDYLVEIERLIKGATLAPLGDQPDTLVVRVPGGVRPDGIGLHVRGAPRFDQGDEVLLFLEPRNDGTFALYQLMLGAFKVEVEGGMRVARRQLSDALKVQWPQRETGGAHSVPADGPRDALGFRRWLEQRDAGRTAPAYFLPAPDVEIAVNAFQTVVSTDDPPPFGCGADGGHSVRWFDFATDPEGTTGSDVGWRTHFSGQDGVSDGGIEAFQHALAAWTNDPNTSIRYVYDGLTAATGGFSTLDGVNAILFNDPNEEIGGTFDGEGLLALGGPWFDCDTLSYQNELFHPILAADIVTQDGLELFFASTPDPSNAAEQLFAHELGHTLGLAHSEDAEALMAALFHPDRRGAALDVDDLAGALYLYGERDLTPPAAPSQLSASEDGSGRVALAWSDDSTNESVFRIERQVGETFSLLTNVAAGTTSFVDAGVEPTTLYGYRVRSQNGAGASMYTTIAEIQTGEDRRPAAPTNLRAAPLSSSEIRLAWQDNSDDETGFVIEVLISLNWVQIPVQLAPDTRRVIVEGLPPASTLSFRLSAVNSFGTSPVSNHVTVTTFSNNESCVVTGDELCLLGGRFKVAVDYRNQHAGGTEGSGTVVPSTDQTGLFWFFSPENVELIVKALDGRHINGHYWLFYGALTDLEYSVTVTDSFTGEVEIYHNPPGEICGLADTAAFPGQLEEPEAVSVAPLRSDDPSVLFRNVMPSAPVLSDISAVGLRPELDIPSPSTLESGSCESGPETLCLLDRRLSVEVMWRNPYGGQTEGAGRAVADSDNTGVFWFFNLENTELVIKALDGGAINDHLWIFYGALTDLEYWITVTDTATGERRIYHNLPGEVCGRADTEAFDTNPPEPPTEPPEDPEVPAGE